MTEDEQRDEEIKKLRARAEAAEADRDALIENNRLKEEVIDRLVSKSVAQHQEIVDLRAKVEMQGRELNRAKYGDADFAWSVHKAAMADLQARLALAVEALESLARLGNGDRYGNSDGNMVARNAIALIEKGKTNETT
jgi:hypothetical protein